MIPLKRVELRIDAATSSILDDKNVALREDRSAFSLIAGETIILCCRLVRLQVQSQNVITAEPYALPENLQYYFSGATSCRNDAVLVWQSSSIQAQVNCPGDWLEDATANPTAGELSFRISANWTAFGEWLRNQEERRGYFCLTANEPDAAADTNALAVLAAGRFAAKNRPGFLPQTDGQPAMEYYTAQEVDQRLTQLAAKSHDHEIADIKLLEQALANAGSGGLQGAAIPDEGFFLVDESGYIGASYTAAGLDAARVSSHLTSLLS